MKKRILKKFSKARHSYDFTHTGLELEMMECSGRKWVLHDLRTFTHYWYRNRKAFKRHTGQSKNRYYDFWAIRRIENPEKNWKPYLSF